MIASEYYVQTCSHSDINRSAMLDKPADTHNDWICQAQNGNLEAFNKLVLIYQDRVYSQALWLLNDEADAEDASQEAFLLAYRNIQQFNGSSFRAWLMRITTNYCFDQIRKAKRRPAQPLDLIDEDGEEFEPSWLKNPSNTSEEDQERSEIGCRISRACAILHIPLGTLKSRLSRARTKLREDLVSLKKNKSVGIK